MATTPRDARFTSDSRYTLTRVFTQFVYGNHAAIRSISVGSSGRKDRASENARLPAGPVGTAMGANSRDRGGKDRVHARVVEKIAFQGGRAKA